MFKEIKQKIKNYFSALRATNKEGGVIFLIPLAIAAGVVAAGAIAAWWVESSFAAGLGQLFFGTGMFLLHRAAEFFTYVLSPSFQNKEIVSSTIFSSAWRSVRDMANMVIVLGFVAVGIATTLRFAEYSAKKLLLPLILVALLVNFSGLFCNIIIQVSNTTTNALLSAGGAAGNITSLTGILEESFKQGVITAGKNGTGSWDAILANAAGLGIMAIFSAWIFFVMAFLLASRYVFLAVLYILSPLAFVAYIFPVTKQYFSRWMKEFFAWSFLGVITAFFIYMSMSVLVGAGASLTLQAIFVSFVFLYIGYKIAKTSSAMGADAVMGMARGVAGLATGAVVGAAGGGALGAILGGYKGAKKGGVMGGVSGGAQGALSAGLNAVGGGVVRAGEALGILKVGTAQKLMQKRQDDEQKGYEALFNGNDADQARGKAGIRKHKPAAIAGAVAAGKLNEAYTDSSGNIDTDSMYRDLERARQSGKGNIMKDAIPQNYLLAGMNSKAVSELAQARFGSTGPAELDKAKFIMEQDALASNLPKMTTAQIGNIDPAHIGGATNYAFFRRHLNGRTIEQMQLSKNPALIAAVKDHIGDKTRGLMKDLEDAKTSGDKPKIAKFQEMIDAANLL